MRGFSAEPTGTPTGSRRFAIAFAGLLLVGVLALPLGDSGETFAMVGLSVLPFAVLAGLAYRGETRDSARHGALAFLAVLGGMGALVFIAQTTELLQAREGGETLSPGAEKQLTMVVLIAAHGVGLGALVLVASIRRRLARILPIDPNRFVHTVALALTIALTISAFAPLIVLGEPIVTALVADGGGDTADAASETYAQIYHLYWMVPVSILAVGYGIRRSLRQCLSRLGLVRPTPRQVMISIAIAGGLVIGVLILGLGVNWLWAELGWARTDQEAINRLMGDLLTPTGAVIVGITAGLGEEIAVRGVLQPRLGIVTSNLFFTALHAGQYNWDVLLIIFALGLAFGLVRKHGNTTMSAIVHGVYDLLIILLST